MGVFNTRQARVLEGEDSRDPRPGGGSRRGGRRRAHALRRRRGDRVRAGPPTSSTSTGSGRSGGRCPGPGSRRCSRPHRPSPPALPAPSSSLPARPVSTPSAGPPRRGPGRTTSSSSASACSPPPSSPSSLVGTWTSTAPRTEQLATVAATIRNNGHVNPEAVYYGRGPFTPRGHPGQSDDRRPVPPARLRHDLGGRLRAGADPRPTAPGPGPAAGVRARRGHRPVTAPPTSTRRLRPAEAGGAATWSTARSDARGRASVAFAMCRPRTVATSTSASSTTRSASRSSASSRRSASAGRARAATFVLGGTIGEGGALPGHHRRRPACPSATPAPRPSCSNG